MINGSSEQDMKVKGKDPERSGKPVVVNKGLEGIKGHIIVRAIQPRGDQGNTIRAPKGESVSLTDRGGGGRKLPCSE